ncbi:LysM peptidoglycan-binding domain-containing protein [Larkinella rosea]|uniref:LysM peptidoglycan-binding domain-containing protein n=1 Tax=Larkinella rosea TaxID=2025312 RepID=A0A3P1BGM1_9BACT|nr:LysM peptidoglycan-binding domain-containing protein [Larkinella rosea]RRB00066.1 LysM peptidoglycan-binding domain-containing protein [Larkinella rosea]
MKKKLLTLSLFLFVTHFPLFAGDPPVAIDVPESIQFADLNVRFDESARRIIRQDITSLIQSNKKYWEAKLDRVVLYFPLIESILAEEEVPIDLKYLAVQESSLTPDAVSASVAVGYWQFKKETATDHGMRVDDEVDERKSIVASTHGAARYFKRNNTVYNNWVTSLYSYYLGTTGVSKLIPAEWSYAKEITLDDKTDRYILRFFAHKFAFESVLPTYRTANPIALVEYPYGSGKTVAQVSQDLKISDVEIRKYNRWILGDNIPDDKEYVLAIPATSEQAASLRKQLQRTQLVSQAKAPAAAKFDTGFPVLRKVNYSKGKPDVVLYEINGLPGIQALAGDNASTLASKARISLSSFLRYNDMSDRDPVTENEVYYLAKKMRKAVVPRHTVQAGESTQSISQMYGIRLKKLLRYNRMDRTDRLQVGRVMWLRERRPGNKAVEIIKMPTTPAPSSRPIAGQPTTTDSQLSQSTNTTRPANTIPRNASERKMYSPKLVESKDSPASAPSAQPESRVATAAPATSQPIDNPTSTVTNTPVSAEPVSAPTVTSQSSGNTQRVVIVRPENSNSPKSDWDATPMRTSSGTSTASARRPNERKPVDAGQTSAPVTASARRPVTESREEPTPVPAVSRSTPAATTTRSNGSGTRSFTHKVESGQTYYSISRLYNVTVDEVLQWNRLTQNDKLAVGQSLIIKGEGGEVSRSPSGSSGSASPDPQVSEEIVYHTVQKGETMFGISRKYGVTVDQIQNWNQLSGGGVNVGQQLKIIKK